MTNTNGKANKQGKTFIDLDKIMHKEEFYKLPKSDRRALMSHWRLAFTTEEIKREMGISTTSFYALLKRLDLPTNLQEWRSNQPSLLNAQENEEQSDATPTTNTEPQQEQLEFKEEDTQSEPLPQEQSKVEVDNDIVCSVNVVGDVDIQTLTDLLKLVRENNLDITIK